VQTVLTAWIRAACRAMSVAAFVATGAIVCFLAVTALTLLIPRERIAQQIREGFETGALIPASYPRPEARWRLGWDQWTDCATLQMAIRGDASFLRELVTPRRYGSAADNPGFPCRLLQEAVQSDLDDPDHGSWRYHRYLHGTTILARTGLRFLSVRGLRELIRIAVLGFGAFAIGLAAWLAFSGRHRSTIGLCALTLAVVFLPLYGIPRHAASLSHGPTAALFILALALAPLIQVAHLGLNRLLVLAALFGSATAIMEFMDGGTPLGLALILGWSALVLLDQAVQGADRARLQQALLDSLALAVAYGGGIAVTFALKIALSILVFGAEGGSSFFEQLRLRIGDGGWTLFGTASALGKRLSVLAPLPNTVVMVLLAGTTAACLLALVSLYRRVGSGYPLLLAVLSLAVVPVWFGVFRNHTTVHAWFMVRLVAWPVAFTWSLVVFAWIVRRGLSSETNTPGSAGVGPSFWEPPRRAKFPIGLRPAPPAQDLNASVLAGSAAR
jgi:hypothetical protein